MAIVAPSSPSHPGGRVTLIKQVRCDASPPTPRVLSPGRVLWVRTQRCAAVTTLNVINVHTIGLRTPTRDQTRHMRADGCSLTLRELKPIHRFLLARACLEHPTFRHARVAHSAIDRPHELRSSGDGDGAAGCSCRRHLVGLATVRGTHHKQPRASRGVLPPAVGRPSARASDFHVGSSAHSATPPSLTPPRHVADMHLHPHDHWRRTKATRPAGIAGLRRHAPADAADAAATRRHRPLDRPSGPTRSTTVAWPCD